MRRILFLILVSVLFTQCSSGDADDIIGQATLSRVDSTNNRLFVLEKNGVLSIFTASNFSPVGAPFVNTGRNVAIHDLLPTAPTDMEVVAVGATTRLFITGGQVIADDTRVQNQILVLDFDGTTIEEAAFSPITVADDDAATTDSNLVLGDLEPDTTNSRIFVTIPSSGQLNTYSTTDGTEAVASVNNDVLTGTPNRLSLDGTLLYLSDSTENTIKIFDVSAAPFGAPTAVDVGTPTSYIDVFTHDNGTILLAKATQSVLVRSVDTVGLTFTEVAAGDATVATGLVSSADLITSSVGTLRLAQDTSGNLFGYIPQSDGMVTLLTFATDLSSFTGRNINSGARVIESIDVLENASRQGSRVYMAASATGDVVLSTVGASTVSLQF